MRQPCCGTGVRRVSHEQLDRPDCWRRLAAESMRHGDFDRAETCCTKTKDFEKLVFLYAVAGNVDKLRRLLKIAEARGDGGQRIHVSMLPGDVLEKIAVLRSAGLHALAYASAYKHRQSDLAAAILEELKTKDAEAAASVEQEMNRSGPGTLLLPHPRITCESNWPRLEVQAGNWSAVLANAIQNKEYANPTTTSTPNLTLKLELVGATTTRLEAVTIAATVTRSRTLKLTTMIGMEGMQEEAAE